jgi:hypothetical protein
VFSEEKDEEGRSEVDENMLEVEESSEERRADIQVILCKVSRQFRARDYRSGNAYFLRCDQAP